MSTISRINFEITSDLLITVLRDFPLADKTLADPTVANVLLDGEWVVLNNSRQLARAVAINAAGNAATYRSFPLWSEKGRTDVLAGADRKMPIIFGGWYEAWTRIYDGTAVVGSGAAITACGQGVKVASISLGGRFLSGLVGHGGGADAQERVGIVTELPAAANDYKLKYVVAF